MASGSRSQSLKSTSSNTDKPVCSLPPEKVFPIQIGCELFRLSGASIASDAPSYFSQFFEDQLRKSGDAANIRTLYIDRDPHTFQEIARHLQGYHVRPLDGAQFVKLFADAQFYSLPRLMSQLFESEIFIQIGDHHFQIPRDIFSSPGDAPNFFTLGFAVFFASPSEVFPGLDRRGLLRPPAIIPPSVPNRSAQVFGELLHLLRGYPLHIRNEEHRSELLRDCRYFHLRGLEQTLIAHHLSVNPFTERPEIAIRLEDVRPSGVQFARDDGASESTSLASGSVLYARPFVDDTPADLILEIGDESTVIDRESMRADFQGLAKSRIASLLQVVAKKIDVSAPPSLAADSIRVRVENETDLTLDGEQNVQLAAKLGEARATDTDDHLGPPPAKRQRSNGSEDAWIVRTGQWRPRIQLGATGVYEIVFAAVKLDAFTSPRMRNRSRTFL